MGIVIALFFALLVFVAQWKFYEKNWEKGLTAQLQFQQTSADIGEKCQLVEVICNKKRMPLPMLQVKFQTDTSFLFPQGENAVVTDFYYRSDVFSAGGNQKITRTLDFKPGRRGYFAIKNMGNFWLIRLILRSHSKLLLC